MSRRPPAAVFMVACAFALLAVARDASGRQVADNPESGSTSPAATAQTIDSTSSQTSAVPLAVPLSSPRGALLTSLYVSTVSLQILDLHSTALAVNRGAVEINPVVSELLKHPGALLAGKIGVAAGTIYAVNKVAKRHKTAAIVTLIAVDVGYAYVVARNYRIASR